MQRIFKYQLETTDKQTIKIPYLEKGFINRLQEQILKVDVQNNAPYIWVLVDDENMPIERDIFIKETGHDCDDVHISDYLGSYQLYDGNVVGHIFGY